MTTLGRPSGFKDEHVEMARELNKLGHTVEEICEAIDISITTFYRWRKDIPAFRRAVLKSPTEMTDAVKKALFRSATGYAHTATKIMQHEGTIITTDFTQRYPPNVTAAIRWLEQHDPSWRKSAMNDQNAATDAQASAHEAALDSLIGPAAKDNDIDVEKDDGES